jgi:hypothetical protein
MHGTNIKIKNTVFNFSTNHSFYMFLVFLIILDFSILILSGERYKFRSVSLCSSICSCTIFKVQICNTVPCTQTHSKTHIILHIDMYIRVCKWVGLLDDVALFSKWLSQSQFVVCFFWVIPRRLNSICWRFGTLCMFHLHRQVGVEWLHLPACEDRTDRLFRNVGI